MNCKFFGTGVAALALLATSFSGQAADMPRPIDRDVRPVVTYYNWTGFYLGVNGGYGWGKSNWDSPIVSVKPKGWMAGGTVGFNYQVGAFVWGLEGDFDWADVSGGTACGAFSCDTKNTWLATARGRLGYALDRWLPYITGGGAFGRVRASSTNPAVTGASDTLNGWTVGGGLEYAFLGNWSAKIEYLYVDLSGFNCGIACSPGVVNNNVTFKENVVRAGINYRFSGPIISRY
jgi:outer membrane immunogenic protein